LQKGYTLLVIDAGNLDRQSRRRFTALVEEHMHAEGLWATAIERGQRLAVVVAGMDIEKIKTITGRFLPIATGKGFEIRVGISSPSRQVDALRQKFQQAVDALTAAAGLDPGTRRVWTYDELGYLGELLARPPEARIANRYTDTLIKIDRYDQEKKTQYLHTLEIYLDHLASANHAAKALYIHRNTLYQRLSKIADLWEIDLHDPLVVLNLNIAIKDWKLNKGR
jgi:DNA-binding PucR family transcriptional regulator